MERARLSGARPRPSPTAPMIGVNYYFLRRQLKLSFLQPRVQVLLLSQRVKKEKPVVGPCGSCGKLAAALFADASFPTRCENVGNLLLGFPYFHSAGSFHRPFSSPRNRRGRSFSRTRFRFSRHCFQELFQLEPSRTPPGYKSFLLGPTSSSVLADFGSPGADDIFGAFRF
jgi:hypothetical protein